ncbi:phage portal protein [Clostridium autoethanogenum]|uniref:Phage portal protein n=1 Tax=Clostridium autoethanogenum TaxID=84023 RepID=A0A3M0SWP4_9CLOT|nr:phage portal protein [Clostridium autoethanogenum]RMD02746.1 phage portal protein [Clostridium autoethanogenum]
MGLFKSRLQSKDIKDTTYGLSDPGLLSLLGIDSATINSDKLGEIVFFTCLQTLSNSVSKLPIYLYSYNAIKGKERIIDNNLNYILNIEPNEYMSASTFWSCVELNRNFYGNCYVYVNRDNKGNINFLWILDTENVTVWRDSAGLFGQQNAMWYVWYDKNNSGKKYLFSADEILHYKTAITWDGIIGMAVKDILSQQIDTQKYGEGYINNLYKNNMFGDKILLQYTGDLGTKAKDTLVKETEKYCNSNGTRFLPIPATIEAKTLSMKLSEAEFSTINNTNALRIAAAFGLNPNTINDYSKSSYANSVSQQTDFYVNTLSPILNMYKQENTRKLLLFKDKMNGNFLEHYTKEIFKLDPTAQMDYLTKGVNNMIIRPNEAREELGYSWADNGDTLIGNGNLVTLDNIISGKTNTQPSNDTNIDNNSNDDGGEQNNNEK